MKRKGAARTARESHEGTSGGADRRLDDRTDRRFMQLALRLARRGRGTVRPNPLVGAVIVRDGKVLARGYHQRAGEAHAEIAALADLARRRGGIDDARGATLYVTLEPCCHQGRTGPCTTAIKKAGFARVVVGSRDPNPRVNGRGTRLLRRAGIVVDEGCLTEACDELNRGFFTWISEGRPFVTLKLAATADGFLAEQDRRRERAPAWITGPEARAEVHRLRAEQDAVLVGAGTAEADDPLLTVRLGDGASDERGKRTAKRQEPEGRAPEPLRVLVDGAFRVRPTAKLFSAGGLAPLVITSEAALLSPAGRRKAARLRSQAEVEAAGGRGRDATVLTWRRILGMLGAREIQTVLVEGGAHVAGGLIAEGLVDRVVFFYGPKLLGAGVPMARGRGRALADALVLTRSRLTALGPDWMLVADVDKKRTTPLPTRR